MKKKSNPGGIFLSLAIIFEVLTTLSVKLSNGFNNIGYSISAVVFVIGAVYFLSKSFIFIPLAIAYAIWVGLGTTLIAILSFFIFNETFSIHEIIGLILIIGGVTALNYFSKEDETLETKNESQPT